MLVWASCVDRLYTLRSRAEEEFDLSRVHGGRDNAFPNPVGVGRPLLQFRAVMLGSRVYRGLKFERGEQSRWLIRPLEESQVGLPPLSTLLGDNDTQSKGAGRDVSWVPRKQAPVAILNIFLSTPEQIDVFYLTILARRYVLKRQLGAVAAREREIGQA